MMQGDQYRLPIELKYEDGTFITPDDVKDIEFFIDKTRKMLSLGQAVFEPTENVYYVFLKQKDTFMMRGAVDVQARLLFNSGDVIGIALGKLDIEKATSKVVLK